MTRERLLFGRSHHDHPGHSQDRDTKNQLSFHRRSSLQTSVLKPRKNLPNSTAWTPSLSARVGGPSMMPGNRRFVAAVACVRIVRAEPSFVRTADSARSEHCQHDSPKLLQQSCLDCPNV
jgi:hypothetical protein